MNWRFKKYELDIIAETKDSLIVVEVKTRSGNYCGEPEFFVTKQKQKLIIQGSNAYVLNKNRNKEVRFDIISIVQNGWKTKINHIEDAFYPTLR